MYDFIAPYIMWLTSQVSTQVIGLSTLGGGQQQNAPKINDTI